MLHAIDTSHALYCVISLPMLATEQEKNREIENDICSKEMSNTVYNSISCPILSYMHEAYSLNPNFSCPKVI